jgi:RNase H-fold protein (predicted Holliday junction resolvase)
MPIGYLLNDGSLMYNLGDIILRYNIGKIVVGYPSDENLQKKVDEFIKQLNFIIAEDISIEKVNEDYTSVQAGVLK